MDELRDEFRALIRHEERAEELAEKYPNAFEEVSMKSYPDSWDVKVKEDGPQSLKEFGPLILNWTDFDMMFEGKWHLIVKENTEPMREEDLEMDGFRDLYGPEENLDDYPDIPSLYCRRAQPLKLSRKPKQRLPFPVSQLEDRPGLHIRPWMLEPTPPTIDWSKQKYKGMPAVGVKPMFVRWEEYPVYDVEKAEKNQMANRRPTLRDMVMPYVQKGKKKKKGLLRIQREEESMSAEAARDLIEQNEKDEKFTHMLIGDFQDDLSQEKKSEEMQDFGEYEVIGKRDAEHTAPKIANPFLDHNLCFGKKGGVFEEKDREGRWKGKGRGGKKKDWDDELDMEDKEYRGPSRGGRGEMTEHWSGKSMGASGWMRGKLPGGNYRRPEKGKEEQLDTLPEEELE